jgi:hypothetical protein
VIPLVVDANEKETSADSLDVRPSTGADAPPAAAKPVAVFELIGELEGRVFEQTPESWAIPVSAPLESFPTSVASTQSGISCSDDQVAWLTAHAVPLDDWHPTLSPSKSRSGEFLLTLRNDATTGGALALGNIRFDGAEVDSEALAWFSCPRTGKGAQPNPQTIELDTTGAPAVWSEPVGNEAGASQPAGTPAVINLSPGEILPLRVLRAESVDTQREYSGRFLADLLDGRGETVILSESVTFHRETLPGFWFGWGYTFDPDQLLCGPTRGDSYSEYTVPCTLPEAIAKFRELAAQQDAGATRG